MRQRIEAISPETGKRLPRLGIGAIFKDEKPYVIEWLAHHRLLGVERFFVADNQSTDGTTELLEALQACGFLACHRFPSPEGRGPQLPAYRMLVETHGHEVEWLAFIDADEFIWPMGEEDSLPAFLQQLAERRPEMGALVLNWASYGSDGQLHQAPEGSGFRAFVPLDPAVVIGTLDIAGLLPDGGLTEPLEQDAPAS